MASVSLRSMDLSESRQSNLYASSTIPCFFAMVFVTLRLWCRWTKRAGFWLDDWLILFALAFAIALMANMLWWIPRGLGRHVQTFGPDVSELFSIGLFTAELTYTGVIVFVKFSILALYWRLFQKSTSIKLPIFIMGVVVFVWGIVVFLLTLLQCIPTRGFWDKTISSSCNVDSQKFLFAISIPNILIDVTLLTMPIPYVIRLNVPRSQKRAIVSMFLLGGFVCVASIMRLIAVVTEGTDADVTWNLINQGIWAVVEADFAIISACFPTLRPVWVVVRPKLFSPTQSKSNPRSYPPTIGTPPKKRKLVSWGMSLLQSKVDGEEDGRPFSTVMDNIPEDGRLGFVQNSQQTKVDVSIPLSSIPTQDVKDSDAIRVDSAWNVAYSQRACPRDNM
ncbi:hypothetical protein F4804DRAFT_349604 [Jackrogersella minutella]|nr:hypothetical protein F4804DRAFT_349604 [Jackrogersella minutella]